ncbi:hypothetical protein [Aneurinibacillus aneurinilyticus]|uniref:hypothetical protein n=1 Tax=Aneurinibacillus aneurinilyticus TaxID=1391 RepID=UPI003526C2E6
MHMDFRVYQLTYPDDLTEQGQALYDYLRNVAKIPGEHGFEYCITNENGFNENIIVGCFSEEYAPNINSVDDDKNLYVPDVAPFLNTFFAIDLQEKRMLIQHRDYPAANLNRDQTLTRLSIILNAAFENIYNSVFNYIRTNREVNDDEFINVFNDHRITLLRVKLFENGRLLRADAEIFDNREINRNWIDGWNTDASNMHEIVLKAPGRGGDGDLRESPLAVSLINLPIKEIIEINYWDEGGSETMSRTDFRKFRIRGIDRYTLPITAVDAIENAVYNRRDEVRRFRAIQDLNQ